MKDIWTRSIKVWYEPHWAGPCGDSFCYASCNLPACKRDRRLGLTPKEHNEAVSKVHEARATAIIDLYKLDGELAAEVRDLFERLKAREEGTPDLVRLAETEPNG